MAIGLECVVAVRSRDDREVSLRSLDEVDDDWTRYVDAVREVLAPGPGIDGVLASSVPPGSGLSSSAALEVAVALALGGGDLSQVELALACQKAEHLATGVPSRRDGPARLGRCAGRPCTADRLPLARASPREHPGRRGVRRRSLGRAANARTERLRERRAECEQIASDLGLSSVRDATLDQVKDEPLARHVVTENERVEQVAAALETGEHWRVGELMRESHASLRDDYAVSTPELDGSSSCSCPRGHTAHA